MLFRSVQTQVNFKIEVKQAAEVIFALFDDELASRMIWTQRKPVSGFTEALSKHFPWFSPTCDDRYSDYFNQYIVDPIYLLIGAIMDEIIPIKTWKIYEIYLKGFDVIIIEGKDYRIHDWEQRVRSGEIKWKRGM